MQDQSDDFKSWAKHVDNWPSWSGSFVVDISTEKKIRTPAGLLFYINIQGDQKVSVHQMITVQKNTQKYFKQFQSLTMIR
jgi:hypothetical protein